MKEATVAIKRTKLIDDEESDYACTPEPNDPKGPYMSTDNKSSDNSADTDSDGRLRSARAFMLIFFAAIMSKNGSSYNP